MNKIDKQVKNVLGKTVHVLSSNDNKHFTIIKLHLTDLNQFYYKWNEKIYAINENIEELIKYADTIIVDILNANGSKLEKNKFYVLEFNVNYFIDYIQFRYNNNEEEKINRRIIYR